MRMRELLHVIFDITDDVMLDLVYHSFDRDNDGFVSSATCNVFRLEPHSTHLYLCFTQVDDLEWCKGLSTMIRGTTDELIEWCYYV